jgi:DNA-binding MarR family transcriptional regulator
MTAIDLMQCRDCLCLASRRAALAITRSFEHRLRPHGIRATQFSMLTQLALRGRLSLGALAAALGVERTTLTRNLALIEKAGWIRSRPGDDARSRLIAITPAGTRKLEAAFPAWQAAQAKIVESIGPAGAVALRRLAAHPIG